jgi:FG-GAP repeat
MFQHYKGASSRNQRAAHRKAVLRLTKLESRYVPAGVLSRFAVGAGAGAAPEAIIFNSDGSEHLRVMAYDVAFKGGVHVALGDVNGDGIPDLVTAPGPGGEAQIKVFDGQSGDLIAQWTAYDPVFWGRCQCRHW